VPISSNGLTCALPTKGYVADSAGWTFGVDHLIFCRKISFSFANSAVRFFIFGA
jgi:hypothetical protein